MNNDERIWKNEKLFSYKDTRFNTESSLDVLTSISTVDNKKFSQLKTTITLNSPDNLRRSCILYYSDIHELCNSIREICTNENLYGAYERGEAFSVDRNYNSKHILKFTFKPSTNGEWCVLIGLISSNTDYGIIILPYKIFLSLIEKLEFIKDNDFFIRDRIISDFREEQKLEDNQKMIRLLTSLPVNLSDTVTEILESYDKCGTNSGVNDEKSDQNSSKKNQNEEDGFENAQNNDEDSEIGQSINQDFENFIDQNLDNIEIDSIDNDKEDNSGNNKTKNNVVETESKLFDKVLKKDISNIEPLIDRILPSNCKIEAFSNTIYEDTGLDIVSQFNNKDIKSIEYISEFLLQSTNKSYLMYGTNFPASCIILRADPLNDDKSYIELAYDLLISQAYIKSFRTMLESKTPEPEENKSKLHVNLRFITDFIVFSFIKFDESTINTILSRFKYYDSNGYFEEFNKDLENYGFSRIDEDKIRNYIYGASKAVTNSLNIRNLHDQMYKQENLKLSVDNNFSKEQITNEIVKLDVMRSMKFEINSENLKRFGLEENEISNNVLKAFTENKKVNGVKEKRSNIDRYVSFYDDQIPDNIKEQFLSYIKSLGNEDYDFNETPFPIDDFGENIVKALYIWNRSDRNEKYSDFYNMCEESIMSKEDIKNKIYSGNDNNENINWSDAIT